MDSIDTPDQIVQQLATLDPFFYCWYVSDCYNALFYWSVFLT